MILEIGSVAYKSTGAKKVLNDSSDRSTASFKFGDYSV